MSSLKKVSDIIQLRPFRTLTLFLTYACLLAVSIWMAYQLRFDFFQGSEANSEYRHKVFWVMLWVVPLKLLVLVPFRQYSGLLSYFGTPDLYRLGKAVFVCSALLGLVRLQSSGPVIPPRGVILIDFILSFGALAAFRIACRVLRESLTNPDRDGSRSGLSRVVVIGAGDEGANLAKELLNKKGLGRLPVAFLDDDSSKHQTRIHNVPVIGAPNRLEDIKSRLAVDEAVIAMPSAPARRVAEIVRELQRLHLKFFTIPSLHQLTTGNVRTTQIRSVEIQDLLGREPVEVERDSIRKMVEGKMVMVTGAGGSIGRELCRQVVAFNPSRLILVDQSEFLLFEIEQELLEGGHGSTVVPLVGNILDVERMKGIFSRYRPSIVYHAAALKHVPMMEQQPAEAVKVNFFGSAIVAQMAVEYEVDRFVMISTDKAINPTSVMGATKRLAEMYIQALTRSTANANTHFMAVRFGNVLGSSGSVIPTFRHQIALGGPVKVTHPDVSRYFMTIPEAVGLVLQCGAQGEGGEIFVLDMGDPIKIVDLAKQMIELSGLTPEEDIAIEFVGLRPGEKLFEELQHSGENLLETDHPKIMRFVCEPGEFEEMQKLIETWKISVQEMERSAIKQKLKDLVPEYIPYIQ